MLGSNVCPLQGLHEHQEPGASFQIGVLPRGELVEEMLAFSSENTARPMHDMQPLQSSHSKCCSHLINLEASAAFSFESLLIVCQECEVAPNILLWT